MKFGPNSFCVIKFLANIVYRMLLSSVWMSTMLTAYSDMVRYRYSVSLSFSFDRSRGLVKYAFSY